MTGGAATPTAARSKARVPPLGRDEVHVWRAWLDRGAAEVAELSAVLSPDERERAARFHFERDTIHFTVARAVLRQLLGAYLALEPARLEFAYGPQGKPALAPPVAPLAFNVSHSGGLALYAIAWDRRVGVDVERRRSIPDLRGLAAQVFAAPEQAELAALPAPRRQDAFLDGWTRKEAFIKARGEGLSCPLDAFVVSLDPAVAARLVTVEDRAEEASAWSLHALTVAPGYAAALVAEGKIQAPTCRTWTN